MGWYGHFEFRPKLMNILLMEEFPNNYSHFAARCLCKWFWWRAFLWEICVQQSGGFLNIQDCFIEGGSGGAMYPGVEI